MTTFGIAQASTHSPRSADMASITIEQALQLAAVYERAGRLADAERICQNVLAARPGHTPARQQLASIAAMRMASARPLRRRLCYAGDSRGNFGWGVCNTNLIRELSRLVELVGPWSTSAEAVGFEQGEVFMPLVDQNFTPCSSMRGRRNFAYTFFEQELGANVPMEAAKYEIVFCGSSWCLERMRERGITNGQVLLQGVNHEIFRTTPPAAHHRRGAFRIFSGGKFEYRKGQDIAIVAFREFLRRHPDATLVCAWNNPWPKTIWTMRSSPHLSLVEGSFSDQRALFQALLVENGIPPANVEILPPLSQQDLAAAMASTDIGLFPNRCEGGTNLILISNRKSPGSAGETLKV